MPVNYSPAPEVRDVAQDIIRDHHARLITNRVHIVYLFTDEAEKKQGKTVLGTARKVSGVNAYLARMVGGKRGMYSGPPDFFLICIYSGYWTNKRVTDDQRRALVDHELSHLWSEEELTLQGEPTGRIKMTLLPHDLQEFNAIVSRHGAWYQDIQDFLDAAAGEEQLTLPKLEDRIADGKGAEGKGAAVTLKTRSGTATMTAEQAQRRYEELEDRARKRGGE